jgi:hypothetical protein
MAGETWCMASLMDRVSRFARSPQGRRLTDRAKRAAKDPATRRRFEQARSRFGQRKR